MQPTTTSTDAPSNRSHLAQPLDDLLADLVTGGRIPGVSLAVTTSTTLLYAGGSGRADLHRRRPASADTPYLWFSLTKIATATAAMALADRGRLDLDAAITEYLPSYPATRHGSRPVVGQLLDHTAGLPNPLPVRWIRPAAGARARRGDVPRPPPRQARHRQAPDRRRRRATPTSATSCWPRSSPPPPASLSSTC